MQLSFCVLLAASMGRSSASCVLAIVFLCAFGLPSLAEQRCLRTQGRHKPAPSKEGLFDCHHFNEKSCCTHDTTRDLVNSSAFHVGIYHWLECKPGVSQRCEKFIQDEMCFYYCSPNTYPWAKKISSTTQNAEDDQGETYSGVPICSTYCDAFYEACKTEPICVSNWYTDFELRNVSGRNERHCKADSNCSTFGTRFNDGRGLCNGIFGDSYVYTPEPDCLVMSFVNATNNPNDAVAARLASSAVSITFSRLWGLIFALCSLPALSKLIDL